MDFNFFIIALILFAGFARLFYKQKKLAEIKKEISAKEELITREKAREEEINRMKSEFISIAAHQLRTPLSVVKWAFAMLLKKDFGDINGEQKDIIEKGMHSIEGMIVLVNDLLNVSRIEEGRFGYEFELASLEEVIETVIREEENLIKQRNIEFKFIKPEEKLPKMKADVKKLSLAFQNLIENALKYTLKKGEVVISLSQENLNLKVEITDNGIGIPFYQMKRLFEKFFRGDNAVRFQTKGTGLGLFIAKNIIEKHGGRIEVFSEEGKGTKIIICFTETEKPSHV